MRLHIFIYDKDDMRLDHLTFEDMTYQDYLEGDVTERVVEWASANGHAYDDLDWGPVWAGGF